MNKKPSKAAFSKINLNSNKKKIKKNAQDQNIHPLASNDIVWIQPQDNSLQKAKIKNVKLEEDLSLTQNELNRSLLQNSIISKFSTEQIKSPSIQKLNKKRIHQKSAVELMENILRNFGQINPYYKNETNQQLIQLITNQTKQKKFLFELDSSKENEEVAKNYEIFLLLFRKVTENQIQIIQQKEQFSLNFNRPQIQRKQFEIQQLKIKLDAKQNQIKQISAQYEDIILDLTQTIQQLSQQLEEAEAAKQHIKRSVRFDLDQ